MLTVTSDLTNLNINNIVHFLINYYNAHHIILLPLIIGFLIGRFAKSIVQIFLIIIIVYIILLYVPLHIPNNVIAHQIFSK